MAVDLRPPFETGQAVRYRVKSRSGPYAKAKEASGRVVAVSPCGRFVTVQPHAGGKTTTLGAGQVR